MFNLMVSSAFGHAACRAKISARDSLLEHKISCPMCCTEQHHHTCLQLLACNMQVDRFKVEQQLTFCQDSLIEQGTCCRAKLEVPISQKNMWERYNCCSRHQAATKPAMHMSVHVKQDVRAACNLSCRRKDIFIAVAVDIIRFQSYGLQDNVALLVLLHRKG